MRRIGIFAAATLILAGAAYYGLILYPQQRFRAALDRSLATLPPGYSVSYGEARYSILSSKAVLRGLTIYGMATESNPHRFEARIDAIEVTRPRLKSLNAWSQAATDPAALAPETMLPVGDDIVVSGIAVEAGNTTVSIRSVHIERPRLYPWALLRPGVPSLAELRGLLANPPQSPPLITLLPMLRLQAAMVLGIGYDHATIEDIGLRTKTPALRDRPEMEVAYNIGRQTGGMDRGVMTDPAICEAITVEMRPLGTFTLERASITGMDVREAAQRALASAALSPAMLDGLKLGRIEYRGMAFALADAPPMALGTLALSNIAFAQGVPVSGDLSWHGVHLRREALRAPQAVAAFDRFGLDAVTLGLDIGYRWDLARQLVTIEDSTLKVDELGSLNLAVEISDAVPGAAGGRAATAPKASLAHARLRYRDASLVERALSAEAARSGGDAAAARARLIAQVEQRGAELGDPNLAAAAQAVAAFLAAPGSLTVELAPPSPVPLASFPTLRNLPPGVFASTLGLKVQADR